MSDNAREARNAYKRQWAKDHPDKIKEYNRRYWAKKAKVAEPAQQPEPIKSE